MLRRTLNLGIVAHVDAGKTTLTERLLYAAGVIDEVGSVDKGTTQTDTLALERQRGITIKSAVVSFAIDGVRVNLIDTPGHPDFIAEVERVLGVLDGAVLVVSGVEGVQPQTRILYRALARLRIPTLIFVNKLDRAGADLERVLAEIRQKLGPAVAADAGAEELAGQHDALLEAYLAGRPLSIRDAVERSLVHPVFSGSALRGDGVDAVMKGIAELLPAGDGDPDGALAATVFKIDRSPTGEKVAYVRVFSGTLHARERIGEEKVTEIHVFADGSEVQQDAVVAGEIAKVWGLRDLRIGDTIGDGRTVRAQFPPPTLESVVVAVDPEDGHRLRVALDQLAEQDPLIDVRQNGELSVSLYGEVQKEVIEATLAAEYDLAVSFREATPLYVERPAGRGEAAEILHAQSNPYNATIGLRVEPGSELGFRFEADWEGVPLYVYKTLDDFAAHMESYVRDALRQGLFGWPVIDCTVTMTQCNYSVADGPPSRRGPTSTAADFRKLTPLVLMQALEAAGTVVCEPTVHVVLEIPADAVGAVVAAAARLGGRDVTPALRGELAVVELLLSAARAQDLQRQLSGLTHGEGVLESTFAGYEPVAGGTPRRPYSPFMR